MVLRVVTSVKWVACECGQEQLRNLEREINAYRKSVLVVWVERLECV